MGQSHGNGCDLFPGQGPAVSNGDLADAPDDQLAGKFTHALGLEMDATKYGMGKRSQRYSMLVEDGVVKELNVEEPGAFAVSSAEHILKQI